jgi:hypothetical protein
MSEAERIADRKSREIAAKNKARAKEVEVAWSKASGLIGGVFAGIGVSGLVNFSRELINGIDALNDFADATGSSVQNASALEDIARRTGSSLSEVEGILVKFNQTLKDAEPNKGASLILKRLGLDAEALKKIDPAEALRQTAVAFTGFAVDGDKARIVQELFGKSVREAAPFLKDLAEKGELNATVTRQQAEEAERLNKAIFGLQKDFTDLSRSIAGDLIPEMSSLLTLFKALQEGPGLFAAFKQSLFVSFDAPADGLKHYTQELKLLDAQIAKTQKLTASPLASVAESSRRNLDDLKAQRVELEKFVAAYSKAANSGKAGIAASLGLNSPLLNPLPSLGSVPTAPKGLGRVKEEIDRVAKAMADLERDLALFGQDEAFKKAFEFEALGAAPAQVEEFRAKLQQLKALQTHEDVQKIVEALERERDEFGKSTTEIALNDLARKGLSGTTLDYARTLLEGIDAQRAHNELMDEGKRLYDQTRTPAEVLNIELGRLNDLLKRGAVTWDTYARAVFDAQDRFDGATKKAIDTVDSFAKRFAENTQDMLGQGLFDVMSGNFKNIGDSFASMVNRMVAEAAAADISRHLFGDLVKGGKGKGALSDLFGGGSGGGFFSALFSSLGSLFGGFRADGGPVDPSKGYIVGERGEEWFQPNTAGRIIPMEAMKGTQQGGMVIQNHFTITGPVDRRTQEQIATSAARGVQRALSRGSA